MFQTVDALKEELLSLEPIKDSDRRRLDEKFRLEFNYNSNHMEGNTLTYQDTKVLLLKDILPQGKLYQMRELEEMKAHDVAYAMIREWAADQDREISERDIRELNKIILVKDFYKDAITPEGQPTRKIIKAGEYKSDPNSVLLTNGEIFHYADPLDVPVKMQELMDWYRDEKTSLHPITLAAVFHHKFVLIHPFDDGNGRISRLLMNYILLKNGFPPVIIKSAEKQKYLNALRMADAGKMEAFINYISEQLSWSLEISIKAAKGESVEEMGDVSKKLDLLLKQESLKGDVAGKYSIQKVDALMHNSLKKLFRDLEQLLVKFDFLYNNRNVSVSFNSERVINITNASNIVDEYFKFAHYENPISGTKTIINLKTINFVVELAWPVNASVNNQSVLSDWVTFDFFTNRIEVCGMENKVLSKFTYDHGISEEEQQVITEYIGNSIINKMPIDYDPTDSNQL